MPLGFEPGAAAEMSKQVTQLAVDLASFNNMEDEDAMQALTSGLLGESEPLKRFGVIANEAAVKAELLSQGLDPKNATDQQKVMARLAIVMKGTAAAQGDAIRSSGSWANQMKRLEGEIGNTAGAIGTALLPVVTPLLKFAGDVVTVIGRWASENQGLFRTIALVAGGLLAAGAVLVAVGATISAIGFAFGAFATAIGVVGAVIGFLISPLGIVVALIAGLAVWLIKSGIAAEWLSSTFGPLLEEATRSFDAIKTALKAGDFGAAAQVLWTTLRYWFAKGVDWLTDLWVGFKRAFMEIFLGLASEGAKAMAGLWSAFQSGIQSGLKMLDLAQTKTANKLLEWAGEDGPLGDVARMIVGADLRGDGMAEDAIAASNEMGAADMAGRDAALAQIEAERKATLEELDAQLGRDMAGMNAGLDAQLQDSADAVQRAREEMDAAIDAAKDSGERSADADGPKSAMDQLLDALKNGAGAATAAASKVDTSGTFSTLASRIFLTRGTDDRIADATEETARHTRKIARSEGLAFQP
ncbi:MAG: hypothetical protein WBC44_03770 [Planctomycetaceae bacterium]